MKAEKMSNLLRTAIASRPGWVGLVFIGSWIIVSLMAQPVSAQSTAKSSSAQPSDQLHLPTVRIAQFDGDRAAAISYTFDDNLRDQYTIAVPMLNEMGFKGTFFVIPGATADTVEEAEKKADQKRGWGGITWDELKEMAKQGHEIASHTWSHPNLRKLSAADVGAQFRKANDAITAHIGKPPLTLAFPFNASTPEIQAIALKYYVAFRSHEMATGGRSTAKSLDDWADKLVKDRKWGVVMTHAIAKGYSAFSDPEIFHEHLKYVKSHLEENWVDTFANVARYEKERESATLTTSGTPGHLACVLNDKLDPKLFNVPLTLVIEAKGITTATAERAGQKLPVHIAANSIYIQAAPGPQPIEVRWKE